MMVKETGRMEASHPRRWYDRQPTLSQSVRLMILLPDEIKSIVSDGIMVLANREFRAQERLQSYRSLGDEKVMGLYKSKNKRREYDTNETLHKAMNYLYILSEDNQDIMADHILQLVGYIQKYLSTCRVFETDPSLEDVLRITQTYIEEGNAEVEQFLVQLREELHVKMLAVNENEEKPRDFLGSLILDQDTLRFRGKKKS